MKVIFNPSPELIQGQTIRYNHIPKFLHKWENDWLWRLVKPIWPFRTKFAIVASK